MSEKTNSASNDLTEDGKNVIIGKQRNDLAIMAAAEIQELCKLMRVVTKGYVDVDLSIRGLSLRAEDLSKVIMSALADHLHPTQELAFDVYREQAEPAEA